MEHVEDNNTTEVDPVVNNKSKKVTKRAAPRAKQPSMATRKRGREKDESESLKSLDNANADSQSGLKKRRSTKVVSIIVI